MRRTYKVAIAVVVMAMLPGCGSGEGNDRPASSSPVAELRHLAERYVAALGRGDAARVCALSDPAQFDGLPEGWCEDFFSSERWPPLFGDAEIADVSISDGRGLVPLSNDRTLALEKSGQRWYVSEILLAASERRRQQRQERRARTVAEDLIEEDRPGFADFCAAANSMSPGRALRQFREGHNGADADHVFSALLARCR